MYLILYYPGTEPFFFQPHIALVYKAFFFQPHIALYVYTDNALHNKKNFGKHQK